MAFLTEEDRKYTTPEDICAHLGDEYGKFCGAIVPPIFQNTLFVQPTEANGMTEHGYAYSRVSNPTTDIAERKIAALEGAGISMGMRGETGAIDHVWFENGLLRCSVIGSGTARGICGSGLIDAVAAALDAGWLNERGKILTEDGLIHLTDTVSLTQEDIRQVQLAKGAIAAGIRLMAAHMGLTLEKIRTAYLAGAFGTHLNPRSACRMGLLPRELEEKIVPVGNAAGSGAMELACHPEAAARTRSIIDATESLELAALPEFPRCFAKSMRF